jgi:biotin carboxyl carrier protein
MTAALKKSDTMPHARNSLRAALEELVAKSDQGAGLAQALVAFQRDLIAAETFRLVGVTRDSVCAIQPDTAVSEREMALCVRALKADSTVAEKTEAGADMATALGLAMPAQDGQAMFLVAFFSLPKATPLAMAMAQERLELSAALARALTRNKTPKEQVRHETAAQHFAESRLVQDGLFAAAQVLQEKGGAEKIVLAAIREGKPVQIVTSDLAVIPSNLLQKYALATGEVIDFGGRITCGAEGDTPAPRGMAAAFGNSRLQAFAHVSERGDGIAVIAVAPAYLNILEQEAAHLATPVRARVSGSGIHPGIDKLLAKMPVLAKLPAEQRRRKAKRWALAGAALLFVLPVPNTVMGSVSIEPQTRRVISAPVMSRLDKVHVQPGDTVVAGKTVLLSLDSRVLQAELDQASASFQAAVADAATARSEGDPDRERAAQLRADQAQAQVALLEYRLAETEIVAPVSGMVMGEDLRRKEGTQISRGDALFEIAAPGAYRAEILVPDQHIDKIVPGGDVRLHLDAFSFKRFTATVDRIYPLTETVRGKNVFRVIARLETQPQTLQPGMGGTARLQSGWQIFGWSLLEPIVDRIRGLLWI